jgi:hypothetical protein
MFRYDAQLDMKFLIQTIDGIIKHDFSKSLIEAIKYQCWYQKSRVHSYLLTDDLMPPGLIPIGSNQFVIDYLYTNFDKIPVPRNIPEELNTLEYTQRNIITGTKSDIVGNKFVKSADKIKDFTEIVYGNTNHVPEGNYIISDLIDIKSEWRTFVYKGKLVGLNNYSGEPTIFPHVGTIHRMIQAFKSKPVAFTLDVGVNDKGTFIIEAHDFFSVGFYGFNDSKIIPNMFGDWFNEYTK